MHIEILGYLVIPLGIILLFLDRKWLLYATVFFMGFTGASILTINNKLSIQPSYYLAVLFMIKHIIIIFKNRTIVKPNILLTIFIAICIFSLMMPFLLENKQISIINQDNVKTTVKFTIQNITQLMYIVFCFVFYWFVKDYLNNNHEKINQCIKILIYGCITVCILGICQEIFYIQGWEFDKFFRSNIHGNIQPYGSFIRIYSTTIEPSMLAYYIAPISILILCLNSSLVPNKYIKLFLITLVGICTISTTFFIGIAIFIIITLIELICAKSNDIKKRNVEIMKKMLIALIIGILAIITIYLLNQDIISNLIRTTLGKITVGNQSAVERTSSFIQHAKIGLQHPILGTGFGSARSKDLFSTWLCNIGVLGLGIFIIYIIFTLVQLKKINSDKAFGIANYLEVLFICAFISVPEPYNLFIWLGIVLAESMIDKENKMWKNRKENQNENIINK